MRGFQRRGDVLVLHRGLVIGVCLQNFRYRRMSSALFCLHSTLQDKAYLKIRWELDLSGGSFCKLYKCLTDTMLYI